MAKYKKYSYRQARFVPIHFDKQIIPGTFEYTLNYLIDNEIDLSLFDKVGQIYQLKQSTKAGTACLLFSALTQKGRS